MANAGNPQSSQSQQQPSAKKPMDVQIEKDLALEIPEAKGFGLWTVHEINTDGDIVLTRPLAGGGFETRTLSKSLYARIRRLPKNAKRIKAKRAFQTGQMLALTNGDKLEVQAFDAGENRAYVRGMVNGSYVEKWVPSKQLDAMVKNEPGSSEKLQETLASSKDETERGMFSGGHLADMLTEDDPKRRSKSPTQTPSTESGSHTESQASLETSSQPIPPATQAEAILTTNTVGTQTGQAQVTESQTTAVETSVQQKTSVTTTSSTQSINELRAELRAERAKQQSVSSPRVSAFTEGSPEEQKRIATQVFATLSASIESNLSTAKQEHDSIASQQQAVAQQIESLARPLEQAVISGDTARAQELTRQMEILEQQRGVLNSARTSVDARTVQLQAEQQQIAEFQSNPDTLPPVQTLLPLIERASALETPRAVAVAVATPSEPSSTGVVALAEINASPTQQEPEEKRLSSETRIPVGTPRVPTPSSARRTRIQGTPDMPVISIKPLQTGSVGTRSSSSNSATFSESDALEYSSQRTPSVSAPEDPFDLKTTSASTHLQQQTGVQEAGEKTEAEKASEFLATQQRERQTQQQFLGLPSTDVLGQSAGTAFSEGETQNANQEAQTPEAIEQQRQLELEQAQMEARAEQELSSPETPSPNAVAKQAKDELAHEAFNKMKLGAKGASVTVVLVFVYILLLHVQIVNEIWPKASSVPPAKLYEKLLCIVIDLFLLVTIAILIQSFLIPFETFIGAVSSISDQGLFGMLRAILF